MPRGRIALADRIVITKYLPDTSVGYGQEPPLLAGQKDKRDALSLLTSRQTTETESVQPRSEMEGG